MRIYNQNSLRIYNKKSDILVQLGKDKKDTKYLDRAVERGEVLCVDGYYIIKDELIWEAFKILLGENEKLKEEIKNSLGNSEALAEAQANVEYYAKENEELSDKNTALESILDNLRAKGVDIGYAND